MLVAAVLHCVYCVCYSVLQVAKKQYAEGIRLNCTYEEEVATNTNTTTFDAFAIVLYSTIQFLVPQQCQWYTAQNRLSAILYRIASVSYCIQCSEQ
jgi:hypothetical protein